MADSLYLLDGHAQIFRAYYAPFRDLTSPSGEPTRATYVFFSMLLGLIQNRRPTYLAMVIDREDSCVQRRDIYPEYKANRDPAPEDLGPQIDRILDTLAAARMPILSCSGFEADDILATLARRFDGGELDVYMVSRDKDLEQLISERVFLFDPGKDEVIDAQRLFETKGYHPRQSVDIQTLSGDSVDNIPGVQGVGVKTAAKLIQRFGSADEVLKHASELTPKLSERVAAFAEQLPITRELVTLRTDVPLDFDLQAAHCADLNPEAWRPAFEELGFTRLLTTLDALAPQRATPAAAGAPAEPSMSPDVQGLRSTPAVQGTYQLVDSEDKLKQLAQELAGVPAFALDTETTSLDPMAANIVGLSISWQAGLAYYVPIRAAVGATVSLEQVRTHLGPIFADPKIKKCGHNFKYDLIVLEELNFALRGLVFDSLLASFLLEPLRRSHSMDALVLDLFDHHMIPISDLIGKGKNQTTIDQIDSARVCEYAAEDADFTWRLYELYGPQIDASPCAALFHATEMPLVGVIAQMERNGVTLDAHFLDRMSGDMQGQLDHIVQQIHDCAGRKFNIDSPKQLATVLFDEQDLRVVRKTKTSRSTDAETLTTLSYETEHPLPKLVLQYRELIKLKSTYVDSLPRMVNARSGKIHARFNMIGAVTGRLSSNDPNLQNIPVRTEIGRQIRKAFVASQPDRVLLRADYSQIELRLLAHFSQDPALLQAFREQQDIHRVVAAEVFGVDPEAVSDAQRGRAKAVNFGIIYGQTAFGLARTTGMSRADAQQFINLYFQRYPGVRAFIDKCIEQARSDGYAATILGRRRPIAELQSRNRQQRNLGERLAVNTVLQGSAADLIKRAMVDIHQRIIGQATPTQMLIQVHDELVFETSAEQADAEARTIAQQMCAALPLHVPLEVDVSWGPNWLERHSN